MRIFGLLMILTLIFPVLSQSAETAAVSLSLARQGRAAALPTKPQIMMRLRELQRKQSTAINTADQAIRKALEDSQNIRLNENESALGERQVQSLAKQLEALRAQKMEANARYQFFEQLVFQFDSKWTNQPLQTFLEQQLLDLAVTDLTSIAGTRDDVDLWRFYTMASVAVREIPEPHEDTLSFLDGYIEFSSIRNPKSPLAYLSARHYTNGATNEVAKSTDQGDLALDLEKKLKDLEAIGIKTHSSGDEDSPADIELRTKTQ